MPLIPNARILSLGASFGEPEFITSAPLIGAVSPETVPDTVCAFARAKHKNVPTTKKPFQSVIFIECLGFKLINIPFVEEIM